MKFRLFLVLVGLVSFSIVKAQVLNIERERIVTDTTGWSGTGKLTLNLINNIQKFTEIGVNAHVQYKTNRSLWLALSDYEVIQSDKDDISNKGLQHFRYNYKINKFLTAEGFAQAQFNKVLSLNFRGLAGAGMRFSLLKKEHLRLYSGLAYMFEYEEPDKLYPIEYNHRMSTYLSLSYRMNENFSLVNTVYFQPRIDYFADYRLSNNLDFVLRITQKMSYVMTLEYMLDNEPLPGVPRNIYSFKNSLVFDFGK